MIICPSCGSSRIRNDYKPAPFALRVVCIRALLCDHCNRQFRAFSLVSPRSRTALQTKREIDVLYPAQVVAQPALEPSQEQPLRISLNRFATPAEPQDTVSGELVTPVQTNLRTEITKLNEQAVKEMQGRDELKKEPTLQSPVNCPECGSNSVRRRHRSGLERAVFSFSHHKAFICRSCSATFYARLEEDQSESNVMNSSESAPM
ncbi:MAG: hypothetical protein L0226_11760 [Acidobacteria bacterium]|nr:hypothetical protein [Acidobacteriota bacterium]